MSSAYQVGTFLGLFFGGCLCGLFPLIVGIFKKRIALGIVLMVVCGVVGFISSPVSLVVGIISGVSLLFIRRKD